MVGAENCGLPGSSRSGLKARKKSLPGVSPRAASRGRTTSRVVPGISGAFQHHELARPEPLGDGPGRIDDVAQVRIARVRERRRHADDDDIGLIQPLKVDRGLEPPFSHLADHRVGDVPDVTFAALESVDLDRVDVKPQNGDPAVAERSGQRQADVAQADDPDTDGRRFDLGQERFRRSDHRD